MKLPGRKPKTHADVFDGDERRGTRAIFALLFAIPIVTTLAFGGTNSWALILIAPLTGTLGAIWIVRSYRSRTFSILPDPTLIALLAFLGLTLVQLLPLGSSGGAEQLLSSGISPSSAISFDPFMTRIFAVRLFFYAVFFAAALTFLDSSERLRRALIAIAVIGGVLAFGGILQKLASPDAIYGYRQARASIPFGPFLNQHHFASLMMLLSGPLLAEALNREASLQRRGLFAIPAVMMAAAVLLTGSRGGFVAYVTMAGIIGVYKLSGRSVAPDTASRGRFAAVAAAAGILITVVGLVVMLGGAESLFRSIGFQNTADDISSGRLHFWAVAWKIFLSHPILGCGMDAFGIAFTAFDTNNGTYRVEQAHNEYLQILADGGIIGLLIVLAFIWFLLRAGLKRIGDERDITLRGLRVGALASCIGILVHSLFDFPLRTAANAFFFLLVAAIAIVPLGRDREAREAI